MVHQWPENSDKRKEIGTNFFYFQGFQIKWHQNLWLISHLRIWSPINNFNTHYTNALNNNRVAKELFMTDGLRVCMGKNNFRFRKMLFGKIRNKVIKEILDLRYCIEKPWRCWFDVYSLQTLGWTQQFVCYYVIMWMCTSHGPEHWYRIPFMLALVCCCFFNDG